MASSISEKSEADERKLAASTIQRNYRGYRSRRQLNGHNMDAASRWVEVVQEAQYRHIIAPRPRSEYAPRSPSPSPRPTLEGTHSRSDFAKQEWTKARKVTQRAHNDDTSESEGDDTMTPEQLQRHRTARMAAKRQREQLARDMGMSYWLEMVDEKHRYGSHLRSYHKVWKEADTRENFFHWLDQGEGLHVDTEKCTREVLDRDRVRYLTREQRLRYLVKFDEQGRLRWARNGERVWTSPEFIDNGEMIVRRDAGQVEDESKTSTLAKLKQKLTHHASTKESETGHLDSDSADDDLDPSKSLQQNTTVPPAAILDQLRHTSGHAKKNTWIFVADTSFRLYVGMKMSGSFQHSSFLHGARVSAAGQIKIKDGRIEMIQPLSGHYRPPVSNFRAFVHSLKEAGADLSHVSIPQSYAVIYGVENWYKVKAGTESNMEKLQHKMEKLLKPEEARKREEAERDNSESARKEAEFLAKQKEGRRESLMTRLKLGEDREAKQSGSRASQSESQVSAGLREVG